MNTLARLDLGTALGISSNSLFAVTREKFSPSFGLSTLVSVEPFDKSFGQVLKDFSPASEIWTLVNCKLDFDL